MTTIASYSRNCTLVAARQLLAPAVSDDAILAAYRTHGYRDNRGMYEECYVAAMRDLGLQLEALPWCWNRRTEEVCGDGSGSAGTRERWMPATLGTFCRLYRRGTYLVKVHGHALIVRDGAVVDPNTRRIGARRRVWSVYRVVNAWVPPAGRYLQLCVPPARARRPGSAACERWIALHELVRQRDPERTTPEQALALTPYTRADLAYDLRTGRVRLVD